MQRQPQSPLRRSWHGRGKAAGGPTMRDDLDALLVQRFRQIDAAAQEAEELERRLIGAGVDPEVAGRAADKAFHNGPLCLAKTRKGTPCLCLGDGRGGRCKLHGGMSTGPKTEEGKRRALAALRRYRLTTKR